jgi:hypothetical protein
VDVSQYLSEVGTQIPLAGPDTGWLLPRNRKSKSAPQVSTSARSLSAPQSWSSGTPSIRPVQIRIEQTRLYLLAGTPLLRRWRWSKNPIGASFVSTPRRGVSGRWSGAISCDESGCQPTRRSISTLVPCAKQLTYSPTSLVGTKWRGSISSASRQSPPVAASVR